MDASKTTDRDEKTGRYMHKNVRVCKCGRFRGVHDMGAPYPFGDTCLDSREDAEHDCDKFRVVRTPSAEQIHEAYRRLVSWAREGYAAEILESYGVTVEG